MNFNHKLAIVIPAYKLSFFNEAINSIASQTCKDFVLYIGDDGSPYNLEEVLGLYTSKINIVFKRFEKNIGGRDLVAQWNRCIDMIQGEEWIWLFSDDDVMDHRCVELFYQHIQKYPYSNLLHFNIKIINEKNVEIYKSKVFSSHHSTTEFFSKVLNQKVYSCAVEYIFRRDSFEKVNRFEQFDLAWSTDTATWMKLSVFSGISTIDGAFIKWRLSTENISSYVEHKRIILRKVNARVEYLNWVKLFFLQNHLDDITTEMEKINWLLTEIVNTSALSYAAKYKLIVKSAEKLNLSLSTFKVLLIWLYNEFKKRVKEVIGYRYYSKYLNLI